MIAAKPTVLKKGGKPRYGKGFSREELKSAGLSLREALKLRIPVDSRRRTLHKENVDVIKDFLGTQRASSKPRRKSKS